MDDEINIMTDNLDPKTEAQLSAEWKSCCMNMCREERDKLLAATDYIHMPDVDVPDAFRAAIVTYRQELRDFPVAFSALYDSMTEDEQDGVTPHSIPFPEKPA